MSDPQTPDPARPADPAASASVDHPAGSTSGQGGGAWAVPSWAVAPEPDPVPHAAPAATESAEGAGGSADAGGTAGAGGEGDVTASSAPAVEGDGTGRRPVPLQRRRGLLAIAGTAAVFVLAGAGFVAGSALRGGQDSTTLISDSAAPGAAGGDSQAQGPGVPGGGEGVDGDRSRHAGRGPGANSATFTAGRITAISGSTITLATFDSTTVRVTTSSKTTVGGTAGGDLSSLKVGQAAFVVGTRQSDGSYVATAITDRPTFDPDGDHGGSVPGGSVPGGGSAAGSDAAPGGGVQPIT